MCLNRFNVNKKRYLQNMKKTIYGIISMKKTIVLSMCLTFIMGFVSISFAVGADGLPRVTQELVAPPFLPKHDQVAKVGSGDDI
jgi:hypothetical protein